MQKPLSVARRDYLSALCNATNDCGLPAFLVVDTLEKLLAQMRVEADKELKRDEAGWRNAIHVEMKNNGNQ